MIADALSAVRFPVSLSILSAPLQVLEFKKIVAGKCRMCERTRESEKNGHCARKMYRVQQFSYSLNGPYSLPEPLLETVHGY